MILRNFTLPQGMKESGWQNLPSAFPYFTKYELSSLAEKPFEERLAFFKKAYGEEEEIYDNGIMPAETISLDDGVYVSDMTAGGRRFVRLKNGISAEVVCAIFSSLCDMKEPDDEEDFVFDVIVPNDECVVLSAVFAMLGGLPIGAVITDGEEDFDCELFGVTDIRKENVYEYMRDFYEDLGYPLGVEDAKGVLAAEIAYDGFGEADVLVMCPFGVFTDPEASCLTYCRKRTDKREEAYAYLKTELGMTPPSGEPYSRPHPISPDKMKELCKMLAKVKLY